MADTEAAKTVDNINEAERKDDDQLKVNGHTEMKAEGSDPEQKPDTEKQAAEPKAEPKLEQKEEKKTVSDAEILAKLKEYLAEDNIDIQTVTERQLRQRLEEHFGIPLKDRKAVMRAEIMEWIDKQPVPEEEDQGDEEEEEEDAPLKKKRKGGGLNAECQLSEVMQEFVGQETMSRPQVVKAVWDYIRAHNLQNPADKRKINLDEKLKTIFTPPLDMFKMNKQLSKHVHSRDLALDAENFVRLLKSPSATPDPHAEAKSEAKSGGSTSKSATPKASGKKRKAPSKRQSTEGEEKPKRATGFTKPLKVSPELAEWLGGRQTISRPELTKFFWAYCKEKDLLNPSNKREVIADDTLKKLLGEERFLAFGYAKYMKKHLLGYADAADDVKQEAEEEISDVEGKDEE